MMRSPLPPPRPEQPETGAGYGRGFLVFSVDYKPQPGGIAEHAHKVAIHLQLSGERVCVLAPRRPGWREFDRKQPFRTYRVPPWPVLDLVFYWFSALYLILTRRVGLVYCATSHPCGLVCRVLRLVARFRYTVTIHAHEVVYTGRSRRAALKRLLKPLQVGVIGSADRVFAVSRFTRDALARAGVSEAKMSVLFNGVDPDELKSAPRDRTVVDRMGLAGKRLVLTIARLDVHKGHDTAIKALPAVLRKVPDAAYVVVGDGPMRRHLEALSRACGVADRVVFTGHILRRETLALLEACSVFVMASRIENGSVEGFGIVFLEAGVFSKPVIGGRSGGIPDAVADGETGLLVDPLDPDDLAGAICRVLTDPDLASRLGAAGYARATSCFTWDRTVRAFLESVSAL